MKKLFITLFLFVAVLASPAQATGFIRASVAVARVRVAPVVQVRKVVQVQQVVAVQHVVAAAIVQPVQAVSYVQPIVASYHSYGYGAALVAPVVAPAYGGDSEALRIERERTKQEALKTEQLRLQLQAK